jgi:segregation and condensation protein B
LENNTQPQNPSPNPEEQAPAPEQFDKTRVLPSLSSPAEASQQSPKTQQPQEEAQEPGSSHHEQLTAQQEETEARLTAEHEKKAHSLVLLEASLYVAGRPLSINEICSALNTRSKKKAQQLAQELIGSYAARNTAMEILQLKDERFVMQIKAQFTPLVKKLVNRPLLSSGPLKTLSYIAYRQPVTSKRVIEVRGQHAYGHIKLLREMDLVTTERSGRSIVLKTTDYFADYFGLTMDTATLKRDLKRIFGEALKDEPQP